MKTFDPIAILKVLRSHEVEFVLIGGFAATAHGSPVVTVDLDICYRRDPRNLERLAEALRSLGSRLRGVDEEVPFLLDAKTLGAGDSFTFITDLGDLDVLGTPAGTDGYEDLATRAHTADLADLTVRIASIDDLIRMKEAAGGLKDETGLHHLHALREEIRKRPG